jgi:UDP-3-O-[3-hydroxymyristoyl] glucosamine N-acyltransferase
LLQEIKLKADLYFWKTGVNRDLEKGTYFGMFAEDFKTYLKKVKLRNLK